MQYREICRNRMCGNEIEMELSKKKIIGKKSAKSIVHWHASEQNNLASDSDTFHSHGVDSRTGTKSIRFVLFIFIVDRFSIDIHFTFYSH